MTTRTRTLAQLAIAALLGALFSLGKLAHACRDPMSEACVWGKAYRSISLPLETLVAGTVVFVVMRIMMRRRPSA